MKYILGIVLAVFIGPAAEARQSPYFPETGAAAVEQDLRSIHNPTVCLFIVTAPGLEDLSSIAYFRVGAGARVAVVYITNGETMPSDLNGETFYQLASRRKEEAYRVLSHLGADSYFLNVPADEFPVDEASFHPRSGLGSRFRSLLDSVISQVKPDMVFLDRNPLASGEKPAGFLFVENLLVEHLRTRTSGHAWKVGRLFVRTDKPAGGVEVPVREVDPVWEKSYETMADEAERCYNSLRYQVRLWRNGEHHRYVRALPVSENASHRSAKSVRPARRLSTARLYFGFENQEIGKELKDLLPAIQSVSRLPGIGDKKKKLELLRGAIARVDVFIRDRSHNLDGRDMRTLTEWKLGLERLRCAVLGISVACSVSDTVVTPLQLFFLRFGTLAKPFDGGTTQVLFPGAVGKEWIVNESRKEFYDWKDSVEFRILSPRSISLNSPETPEGFRALQVRSPFEYIVVHTDPDPACNFMFRGSIPLVISPFRSIEVLTPHVAVFRDTAVVVRFKSNVRDKAGGKFYVEDSIVSSPRVRIELLGKNSVLTDTLPLVWRDATLAAPRRVQISTSTGVPVASFIVHPLNLEAGEGKKVGFYSTMKNSPLELAISRLGIEAVDLGIGNRSPESLSEFSTIVVDRFAFGVLARSPARMEALEHWVHSGGRLLVMPQYGIGWDRLYRVENKEAFSYLPVTAGMNIAIIDSTNSFITRPNRLTVDDIESSTFPGAFGGVAGPDSAGSDILIASKNGTPLLVEVSAGRGRILLCALNLYPRFLAVDEGAYKLLANVLHD